MPVHAKQVTTKMPLPNAMHAIPVATAVPMLQPALDVLLVL